MLNFIIYEENKELIDYYKIIILNSLAWHEEEFKIYNYENYIDNNNEHKIYIISTKKSETAIAKANEIRKKDDWHSQIIILSEEKNINYHNNLLILEYISKNEDIQSLLKKAIITAYKILSSQKGFKFTFNGEIYKIPYANILYIEKRNNQNYCNIHTKNKTYLIKNTIKEIEEQIDNACFLKTHRSCIINLCNVTNYNYSNNIISFENKEIDLISREKRQLLKEKLLEK